MRTLIAALLAATLSVVAPPALAEQIAGAPIEEVAASLAANRYVWADTGTGEAISIRIEIGEQRAYVYRGARMIGASSISTGKDGKETPAGDFTILQKRADHRSNLYNDAPMPFMQRLTWDGVAIHAGRNPGFPASHGCIRVPIEFAKKLFAVTAVGTEVSVIDSGRIAIPAPPADDAAAVDTAAR